MKALLINPDEPSIQSIDVSDEAEIAKLIGYETIIQDDVGSDGDKLFFDEECFLRGKKAKFRIDTLVPVSGLGIVIGTDADGSLADLATDAADIEARTQFL